MNPQSYNRFIRVRQSCLGLVFALSALPCVAATINKAATGTNLNDGPSWVDGTVPTASDIASWDSSSLCTGLTMAAYLPLGGISVGSASSDIDTQVGQWSSDMIDWHISAPITPVLIHDNGSDPDDMEIRIPLSNESGGKLFGRLNVTQP